MAKIHSHTIPIIGLHVYIINDSLTSPAVETVKVSPIVVRLMLAYYISLFATKVYKKKTIYIRLIQANINRAYNSTRKKST